ncbi:Methyltransferase domain-containing protein [Polaromonas sp. YR568]|uniref:methyltransferase regulatory domain-containing protein n=1 Tax=Polaromonas sp. YR568 TaxID=1855301 RepID=UPI0008EB4E12|nr:class I SAM-dependent methyltransferase [Polaromonas sp. YR568]SFU92519.1 Methyltransferase domain-containing protein [Polaromonas sp. YR568]
MSQHLTALLQQSYDETPYASHPFAQTTPERLEGIATLFGLAPTPPTAARVLELGCASGGNIIPFALRHPEAHVVGLDLSAVQIEQGLERVRQLGITNLELRQMNLEDVDASLGSFDYILCHGVYSWVPDSVQKAIMRICRTHLTPAGIAYISFNTYPGWKAREIVRDAMLFRAETRTTPADKMAYARGMTDFLVQMSPEGSLLRKALDEVLPTIEAAGPTYLMHEFLEHCNQPMYFRDFVASARMQGLDYLADAEPQTMFVTNHGPQVAEPLLKEAGSDQVLMEQYLDFLTNRSFRQSLLVHAAQKKDVKYRIDPGCLQKLHYAWREDPQAPEGAGRAAPPSAAAAVHAALDAAFPATLSFAELCAAAPLPVVTACVEELVITGRVRYACRPVACASAAKVATGRALAYPAAALRPDFACNIWHQPVKLSAAEYALLLRLQDGAAADIEQDGYSLERLRRFGLLV